MKKLCKLDYNSKEDQKIAYKLVIDPIFICEKCGRFASDESVLCKAVKTKRLRKNEE